MGSDIICQAKSGMGKTAVFVLSTLHLLGSEETPDRKGPVVLVLAHTRELALQISREYARFSKYLPTVKCQVVYGGMPIKDDILALKSNPQIIVGTPGRLKALVLEGHINLSNVKHFVLDECDSLLEKIDMRGDVQQIFLKVPRQKQVLMFTATLPPAIREICRKFMKNPIEVLVDNDSKLTLTGLQQYFVQLQESEKTRKLATLMDKLEFNQIIIFVKTVERCKMLSALLNKEGFPCIAIHGRMKQEERVKSYSQFKEFSKRILVSTDIFGRGMDFQRVNIVINYDMPNKDDAAPVVEDAPSAPPTASSPSDMYLHRVARAGRFGTKGLAISFVSSEQDVKVLNDVQARFEVAIGPLPESLESEAYLEPSK